MPSCEKSGTTMAASIGERCFNFGLQAALPTGAGELQALFEMAQRLGSVVVLQRQATSHEVTISGAAGAALNADTMSIFALGFSGEMSLVRVAVADDGSFNQLMPGALPEDVFRLLALRSAERLHSAPIDVTLDGQGKLVSPLANSSCIKLSSQVHEVSTKVGSPLVVDTLTVRSDCNTSQTVLEVEHRLQPGTPSWTFEGEATTPFMLQPAEERDYTFTFFPYGSGVAEQVWVFKVQADVEPSYEAHLVSLIGHGDP